MTAIAAAVVAWSLAGSGVGVSVVLCPLWSTTAYHAAMVTFFDRCVSRTLPVVVLVVTAALMLVPVASASPPSSSATTAREATILKDKRGDAKAPVDITKMRVSGTHHQMTAQVTIPKLRQNGVLRVQLLYGGEVYHAVAHKSRDSNRSWVEGFSYDGSETYHITCEQMRVSWRPARGTVLISVPSNCMGGGDYAVPGSDAAQMTLGRRKDTLGPITFCSEDC